MNRKNPCKSADEIKTTTSAEIIVIKEIKSIDIANKIKLEQIKDENRAKEIDRKKAIKEQIQIQKQLEIEAKKEMIAAKERAKQQDLENKKILKELDLKKFQLIEEAKTNRKQLTVKAINSKIDLELLQIKNQQMAKAAELDARIANRGRQLIAPSNMNFCEVDLEKFYGIIYRDLDFKQLFLKYDSLHEVIAHILQLLLNNEKFQNNRCLFYFNETEQFYSICFDITKRFIETSFTEVYNALYTRIEEICRTLVISGKHFFKFTDGESEEFIDKKFEKFNDEYIIFKKSKPMATLAIAATPSEPDVMLEIFMKSFEKALGNIVSINL
jgi:hypothetical protein